MKAEAFFISTLFRPSQQKHMIVDSRKGILSQTKDKCQTKPEEKTENVESLYLKICFMTSLWLTSVIGSELDNNMFFSCFLLPYGKAPNCKVDTVKTLISIDKDNRKVAISDTIFLHPHRYQINKLN